MSVPSHRVLAELRRPLGSFVVGTSSMNGCGCTDRMGWNPTEETFNEFANRSDDVELNPPYPTDRAGKILDMGDAGLIWMSEARMRNCGLGSYPDNGQTGSRCRSAMRTWAENQSKNKRSRKQAQQLAYATHGVERTESRKGKTIYGYIDPSSSASLSHDPTAPVPMQRMTFVGPKSTVLAPNVIPLLRQTADKSTGGPPVTVAPGSPSARNTAHSALIFGGYALATALVAGGVYYAVTRAR